MLISLQGWVQKPGLVNQNFPWNFSELLTKKKKKFLLLLFFFSVNLRCKTIMAILLLHEENHLEKGVKQNGESRGEDKEKRLMTANSLNNT